MSLRIHDQLEPIVITGIGLITSVGDDREAVWRALRRGTSGVRSLAGLRGFPDDVLLAADVDLPGGPRGRIKAIRLAQHAAAEAVSDAQLDFNTLNRDRFGCAISGFFGDVSFYYDYYGHQPDNRNVEVPYWEQWLPNTACSLIANEYGLCGPRLSHSTACASGLIDFLSAIRSIRDGHCDIALAGSGDSINELFASGFNRMRVLAHDDDPTRACRPFDKTRKGFVLGEGGAVFVVERLSHALARGAQIYAEVLSGKMLSEAHHVTGLDAESEALTHLIDLTLRAGNVAPDEIGYINAHGTGTEQNDLVEARGIRRALGSATSSLCVSSTKSMLGHGINAAGSMELAVTLMALRDGFGPPTLNLTDPDDECHFDCLPLVGRRREFDCALKLSLAFGGHLVAVALRRWNDTSTGFARPTAAQLAADDALFSLPLRRAA